MNMGIYYTYQHEDAWKVALERGYLQGDPRYAMFNDEGSNFSNRLMTGWLNNMSNELGFH